MKNKKKKVLGDTSTPSGADSSLDWKRQLKSREDMLKYIKTAERYWYS